MTPTPLIADPETELARLRKEVAELEQELAAFRQILDAVPDMVLYKGPGSHIRWANQAFRSYYGLDQAALRGMIDAPFAEPDLTQQYIRDDLQVFTSGMILDIPDEPVARADGVIQHFHTVKTPIRDGAGAVIGTVGISHNMHERYELAAALAASDDRLQRMIANVPGMVYQFVLHRDGTSSFPFVSDGSRELYGLEPAEIQADVQALLGRIHPDDQASFAATLTKSATTLQPWQWEGRTLMTAGERWVQGYSRPARQPSGDIVWDGLVLDITQRKIAEQEQERFGALVAATTDFVGISDNHGNALYINPAGRALVGLAPDAPLAGRHLNEFHPTWAVPRILEQGIPHAVRAGSWQAETALLTATGEEIPISQVILRHLNAAGEIAFFSTVARDTRERQRAEAERQRLQDEIIRMQADTLAELSTPLITVTDSVVLLPLIGAIDTQRAQGVIETLLEGVGRQRARLALLDLTGVPVVNSQVASVLIQAAQAVRLLGADVVITGIRPEIAQTLVNLGIDLSSIVTRSSVQTGIRYALEREYATPRA